jgi:hypothetical protein
VSPWLKLQLPHQQHARRSSRPQQRAAPQQHQQTVDHGVPGQQHRLPRSAAANASASAPPSTASA